MIFSLPELVKWLGLTVLEIWVNLVSVTIFTVLVALKLDDGYFRGSDGWWLVFSPLFVADCLNAYFVAIIMIRMYVESMIKIGVLRNLWSGVLLLLVFVFKCLLCRKLAGQSNLEYSEVFSPIFILLQLVAIRACQIN